jgi:GDP-4-dehydro-6-deoxy-D-mannose reductase
VSKAAQTLLCLQYHAAYGLPIVCTRSFTHTGPGQSDRFVFSNFARQIAEQERDRDAQRGRLAVGNLKAVRDISDVRDVARAYAELALRGRPGEVYNVCSGRGVSIAAGLDILRERSTLEVELREDPARLRPLDVPVFVGDASKLRTELDWSPSIGLEESLGDLLQYWRDRVAQEPASGSRDRSDSRKE